MTIDEAIEYYSKAATQRAIADEEIGVNDKWNETKFMTKKESDQMVADNWQLVEWLTELKELKNSIKLSNTKEALELIREYKAENIEQKKINAEYKRLLKKAMEDMNTLYEAGKDEGCIGIKFKWRFADEALRLIGDESSGI